MIIGFTGKAGSGKDTAAMALVELGFKRTAFADDLKSMVNGLFGWDDRHSNGDLKGVVDPTYGFSPRSAYQVFGTNFIRHLDVDFWLNNIRRRYYPGDKVVITDVRFENEATFVRDNGFLIHIERDNTVILNEHESKHESERGVDIDANDVIIKNNTSIPILWDNVKRIYEEYESLR